MQHHCCIFLELFFLKDIGIVKEKKEVRKLLSKVTMILRGYSYEEVRCVAKVLCHSKYVKNMEITLNSNNPYDIIKRISDEFKDILNVGAGTVQTYEELKLAIAAGATFVLSPRMMSTQMLDYCKRHNVISVPGSFTPSEIAQSFVDGADVVKVFPANEVSVSYAKKVREPMGELALMAVGGVSKNNAKELLDAGYTYVGTAGGLFAKEDIKTLNEGKLLQALHEFELALE